MTDDFAFRHLLLRKALYAFRDAKDSANLGKDMENLMDSLLTVLGELARFVLKEEGFIVSKL
jgi:hypothetical protein